MRAIGVQIAGTAARSYSPLLHRIRVTLRLVDRAHGALLHPIHAQLRPAR